MYNANERERERERERGRERPINSSPHLAAGYVMRDHSCDFESSLCGWLMPEPPQGEAGLTTATTAPTQGPSMDANPGTEEGVLV